MAQPDPREGLARQPQEPLLPIERKLIGWSLGLGIGLLAALAVASRFLPPG